MVRKKETYKKWLSKNDYNPDDQLLSHGWLEIGQVDVQPLFEKAGGTQISAVHNYLSNFLDIMRIETISEEETVSCDFDANWNEERIFAFQKKSLSEAYETFC